LKLIRCPRSLAATRRGFAFYVAFPLSSIQNALGITTSDFHDNAHNYAAGLHNKVILVDGRRLAELMIEHNIGVAPEQPYIIKKIDSDYFEES